jgi:hypothetical protein
MKTCLILVAIATAAFLAGCATTPQKQCSAKVAHSPTEYDLCISSNEAKEGDRVAFYKKKCTTASRGSPKRCHNEKIGEGVVLKNLDEHLSTVKLDSEFEITESTTIQRKQ